MSLFKYFFSDHRNKYHPQFSQNRHNQFKLYKNLKLITVRNKVLTIFQSLRQKKKKKAAPDAEFVSGFSETEKL